MAADLISLAPKMSTYPARTAEELTAWQRQLAPAVLVGLAARF
jgi:hypothetical protein